MNNSDVSGVNDYYFDGIYKDIWKSIIPQKLTDAEVDFMVKSVGLHQGSDVLDIMCGYGRHTIALARLGCYVLAIDNLHDYIEEIQNTVRRENLPVDYVQCHVLNFHSSRQFDLAICMGNSLNFFNRLDTLKIMANVNAHLKTGGKFLINSWSLTEIVVKDFISEHTGKNGDIIVETMSEYLFNPTRIETTNIFTLPNGEKEEKKAIDYVFSFAEMKAMLTASGFKLISAESIPGRKPFALGEPRIYLLAEKI